MRRYLADAERLAAPRASCDGAISSRGLAQMLRELLGSARIYT